MKQIIKLTLAFAAALALSACGHELHGDGHKVDIAHSQGMVAKMTTTLGLDEKQSAAIEPIVVKVEGQMKEIQADESLDAKAKAAKMSALLTHASVEIKKNLTEDQKRKYDEMVASSHKM